MTYQRKTVDEWQLQSNWGYGWDVELVEDTFKAAREQRNCYRNNCPTLPLRIVKKRIPKEAP